MDPSALPNTSNLFGLLSTDWPPERVANLFASDGWRMRKCSWTDYEVACEVADLVIELSSDKPTCVLIHGAVADLLANLPSIIKPLATASVPYSLECYNERFELIHRARG